MKFSTQSLALLTILFFVYSCSGGDDALPDCDNSDLSLSLVSTTVSACGVETGSITVEASGGSGNYTYNIDGTGFISDATFSDLASGDHLIQVSDGSCFNQISVFVGNTSGLAFGTEVVKGSGCETSLGSIVVNAVGGSGALQYQLDGNGFQQENVFEDLSMDTYTLEVKDELGCSITKSISVDNGTSFSAEVESIIDTNCAVSGCHVASQPQPDFTVFSNVKDKAEIIVSRVNSGTMPPASSGKELTEREIELINCWVEDGAQNN